MKVAVIGAGWYGCHLAVSLANKGAVVDLYEKNDDIFLAASRYNQNRLHEGYHYPRDYETRKQSKVGFDYFVEKYPELVEDIETNIYAVASKNSLVDYETFKIIMHASGVEFEEYDVEFLNRELVSGAILTNEKLIRNDLASKFFEKRLSETGVNLFLGFEVSKEQFLSKKINNTSYDYVINTTWGTLDTGLLSKYEVFYEPCIYFYYRPFNGNMNFALTLMDGALFSLYPFSDGLYTLTSVEHTPITKTKSFTTAVQSVKDVCDAFIEQRRKLFEEQCIDYFPEFLEWFSFEGVQLSIKTKINSASDSRYCIVESLDGCIDVFSGKIDTINFAEEQVCQILFGDQA